MSEENIIEEKWKDIVGYEGYYQVSNYGNVKSLERKVPHEHSGWLYIKEKILVKHLRNGYVSAHLSKDGITKKCSIHRIVAKHFLIKPDGKNIVNHKNSIRNDNYVDNLEWVTKKEDIQHALKKGRLKYTVFRGESHVSSKLTEEKVKTIRESYKTGKFTLDDLAEEFKVHKQTIFRVIHLTAWSHVK